MSLFAGVVFADNPQHVRESHAKLYKALKGFRPDPLRVWESESAVLLATTADGDLERCPLTVLESGRDDVVILATSRLDYPEELASKLGVPCRWAANKARAAEVLLAKAYLRWGERCVEHLDGDFAFAILDRRSGRIFAVRDRLGVFPFYYFRSRSGFYFANNMRILRNIIGSRPVNINLMIRRIQFFEQATDLTMLEGVFRLPAAHTLQCQADGEPAVQRYWSLHDLRGEASDDFYENAARLKTLLIDSTRRRLPDESSIAVHLSGGLDSTAIAGAAALTCRDRLYSYSAVFPGIPEADDTALIQIAVSHHQLRNETFDPVELDILGYSENALLAHGDFFCNGNVHLSMRMLELAERDGCNVILNGEDGDNIASTGLYLLPELARAGRWWEFGSGASAVADIYASYYCTPRSVYNAFGRPILREKAAKGSLWDILSAPLALSMSSGLQLRDSVRPILSGLLRRPKEATSRKKGTFGLGELNSETLADIRYRDQVYDIEDAPHRASERAKQMDGFLSGRYEHSFEFTHSISAKYGLITHSPFMDLEVIKFCLAVPSEHKLRKGWTRAFLRHGMGDLYPPQIAWQRKKSNLSGGVEPTIGGQCLPAIEAKLEEAGDPLWQLFDPKGIRKLVSRDKEKNSKLLYKIFVVWAVSRCLSFDEDNGSSEIDPVRTGRWPA